MAYRVNCPKIINQEQKYIVGQEVVGKGKKEWIWIILTVKRQYY